MIVRFMKYSRSSFPQVEEDGVTATQCFECSGKLEMSDTGQVVVHVDIKDDHRPFDAIEVQADISFVRREYRSEFPPLTQPLRSVYKKCVECGHSGNLHEHHSDAPRCLYTDSEGPCSCGGFRV